MRCHQTSRYDLKAFQAVLNEAAKAPTFTPSYLAELARRRDQYLANLAK